MLLHPAAQPVVIEEKAGVQQGGAIEAFLGHALLKKSILGFWHLPIKLEPLSLTMTLFYLFGSLKPLKVPLKFAL